MYALNLVLGTYIYNDRLHILVYFINFFVVFFEVHFLKIFNNIHTTSKLNILNLDQSMVKIENITTLLRV